MSLKAPSGGGQRPIPPAGAHPATCYSIIDIGTQKKAFKGQEKMVPSLMIIWEFPNLERHTFDEAKGPQPLAISQEYTVSVAEKSNLYKDLQNWRGVPPSDLEKELPMFLGQSCLINVIHNKSQDGTKTYANVSGIMRLPQGLQVQPLTNQKVLFNLDQYSHENFMKVPGWIRKKIMACTEWPTITAKYGMPPVTDQPQSFNQPPQGFNQGLPQNNSFQQQGQNQGFNQGFNTDPINTGNPNEKPPF